MDCNRLYTGSHDPGTPRNKNQRFEFKWNNPWARVNKTETGSCLKLKKHAFCSNSTAESSHWQSRLDFSHVSQQGFRCLRPLEGEMLLFDTFQDDDSMTKKYERLHIRAIKRFIMEDIQTLQANLLRSQQKRFHLRRMTTVALFLIR